MKYTKNNIKPFKGHLITIHVKTGKNNYSLTGMIISSAKELILFDINNTGKEVPLKYINIIDITEPEKV